MANNVAVPLLEGVYSSAETLALRCPTTIGGLQCDVLLPVLDPAPMEIYLKPPNDEGQEFDPDWLGWSQGTKWGLEHGGGSVTISAVGIILISGSIPWDQGLLNFDHAVGRWRHLLRDWLSVIAEGPTDFLDLPIRGETMWDNPGYTDAVWEYYYDNRQRPQRVSQWQWAHALAHTCAGDQAPLARGLLTTAKRAAATGNLRQAVIDAATAAEVALSSGLTDRLSAEASPNVVQALIDRTKMLGPRLSLAKDLGMTLPERIRPDLVEHRNAVVHRGSSVTDAEAQAAITVAAKLVDEYEPLAAHCREPGQ